MAPSTSRCASHCSAVEFEWSLGEAWGVVPGWWHASSAEGRAVRVALAEAERSGNEAGILQLVAWKQQVERAIRAL